MGALPSRAELLGLASGWLLCLLVNRLGIIRFAPPSPGSGIPNWCTIHGYAKSADWFWFAAYPLAGIAGARLAGLLARRLRGPSRTTPAAAPPPPVRTIPWAWWVPVSIVLAGAWVADPCLRSRELDLLHEGVHLLDVESWLAGDIANEPVRTLYGPLYTRSIAWWMSAGGMTVLSMRWYFLAVQAAGMIVALLCLRAVVRSRIALAAGAALLLCSTCTGPSGWANVLRVGLPLASVALVGIPRPRPAAAGALWAVSMLYSWEYGLAGLAASGVAVLLGPRDRGRIAGAWTASAGLVLSGLWVAVHGMSSLRAAQSLFGDGYLLDRLGGHTAYPLPAFRWPFGDEGWSPAIRALSIWIPVFVAGAALAAAAARGLTAGLASFALLALGPAIARPLGHQALGAPGWILVAAIQLDGLLTARHRAASAVFTAAAAAWCLVAADAGAPALVGRWTCRPPAGLVSVPADYRLGAIMVSPETSASLGRSVTTIRRLCPADGRLLIAAPSHLGLSFIAGRAAVPPFPFALLAVSKADRDRLIESLDRWRPPLAVVSLAALEVPLPEANPELWRYLRTRYEPLRTVGPLVFYLRR